VDKEDLDLVNHLSGKTQKYLKLSFKNISDLVSVKTELLALVEKNQKEKETQEAYEGWYNPSDLVNQRAETSHILSKISEIREYDVPYHIRVSIDNELRCSFWYSVDMEGPMMVKYEHLK
jgi:DNA polymerase epsilon subunit 1